MEAAIPSLMSRDCGMRMIIDYNLIRWNWHLDIRPPCLLLHPEWAGRPVDSANPPENKQKTNAHQITIFIHPSIHLLVPTPSQDEGTTFPMIRWMEEEETGGC